MSKNVNKKIVLRSLICYSIDRFGFGYPAIRFWGKDPIFRH